jgi:hypothetical protein
MKPGKYHDFPTFSIENSHLKVEFLADGGPRITGLKLSGEAKNLLAETPDMSWTTKYGVFNLFGGHRLWISPEIKNRTDLPDNQGVRIEEIYGGVQIEGAVNELTQLKKTIMITLRPDRPGLRLVHKVENEGLWSVELAPWAITQLKLGGRIFLPQLEKTLDPDNLLPNRSLVMWAYAKWSDPRLILGDQLIKINGEAGDNPFKLGYFNHAGWAGYQINNLFFCKRFTPYWGVKHPDMGCNTEVYVYNRFIELETLGPLGWLQPGECVEHVEDWEIYTDLEEAKSIFQFE